jgi:hypothetical protein
LEPLYLHRGLKPLIPVKTYFHLWMLVHHVIGCGKASYLAAFARPDSVNDHVPDLTVQTGLYALSVFRLEEFTFEAQKLRLIDAMVFPHDVAEKRANEAKIKSENLESFTPAERFFIRSSQSISGFFNIAHVIRDSFKGPAFDQGYPELYPTFRELDSGAVVLVGQPEHPDKAQSADVGPAAAE